MRRDAQPNHFCRILRFWVGISSLILCLFVSAKPHPEILVVANAASQLTELTHNEIRQIYMGGTLSRKYHAVALKVGSPTRIQFNTKVIGLTENRIQSYWAQLLFTGRSQPPPELASTQEVLHYVTTVSNAIGYLPAGLEIPPNVIVVYKK
ncbi:hypothetical protein [Vibrio mangrovi]|uniref:Phosphate ABC transporter substrate-binding protein n=1 Tax=Vibrio mangrovi TaxID=474394 RepID=A0A1Y6IXB8_9VIBR|nr:hypothetical protein [Vibrio mangrovi]MDW6004899.1 hypothetical protein [Vibrio mangrovi]SMS01661.1 hypothetical protein VIM7927_02965 [Vibrio mangrovi]